MKTEAQYRKLVADLKQVEERKGGWDVYLTDEGVDRENVLENDEGVTEQSPEYWERMYQAAAMAAGARAEELGFCINKELGYTIY